MASNQKNSDPRLLAHAARRHQKPRCRYRPEIEECEPRIVLDSHPLSSLPALNSLPGAQASLYLNFLGNPSNYLYNYVVPGSSVVPVFSLDSDPSTFSDHELSAIETAWQVVAEDYAPFNINVTTVPPTSLAGGVEEVDIGGPSPGFLGLSVVGSFSPGLRSLSWVAAFDAFSLGTAISHEAGHSFGLNHQPTAGGIFGTVPIMQANLSGSLPNVWWSGWAYPQNDVAVIAGASNGFGYRPEPANTVIAAAAPLAVDGNQVSAAGIIIRYTDQNYFSFETGGGPITLSVQPLLPYPQANLVPRLQLLDSQGTPIATADPPWSYDVPIGSATATITTTLAAGSYRLAVSSAPRPSDSTLDLGQYWGNVGQYVISGTVPPAGNINQPPTVANAASANPNPVAGATTNLSVLGADDGGESNLTYSWSMLSGPAPVFFSVNGSNAAKNTTATFTQAGTYAFRATITDQGGLSATSDVSLTVNQTVTSIRITPNAPTVNDGTTQQFTANAADQFGQTLSVPTFTWSIDSGGIGSVSSTGLYAAPASGTGSATVRASSGAVSATSAVTVQAIANSTLGDAGFEAPNVGSGSFNAFQYDPTGVTWNFSGGAGVAGNGSGFTGGNPNAPEGSQVGFLQGTGSFSQTVNLTAGTYQVSFSAAQRGNWQSSSQTFQVAVDGAVVGTFTPAGTGYGTLTTNSFAVSAGAHTIQFAGLNPNGGDNTAFVDQVQLSAVAIAPALTDAGFEAPTVGTGTFNAFQYDPASVAWNFSGSAGVAGNGSGFTSGNPNAPEGTQVGFLQGTGSFSQAVDFGTGGTFTIAFQAAQRGNWQASWQTFQLLVDNTVVGIFTPAGTGYTAFTTDAFTVAAGSHTIQFVGLNPNGGDNTAFIDAVSLNGQ